MMDDYHGHYQQKDCHSDAMINDVVLDEGLEILYHLVY